MSYAISHNGHARRIDAGALRTLVVDWATRLGADPETVQVDWKRVHDNGGTEWVKVPVDQLDFVRELKLDPASLSITISSESDSLRALFIGNSRDVIIEISASSKAVGDELLVEASKVLTEVPTVSTSGAIPPDAGSSGSGTKSDATTTSGVATGSISLNRTPLIMRLRPRELRQLAQVLAASGGGMSLSEFSISWKQGGPAKIAGSIEDFLACDDAPERLRDVELIARFKSPGDGPLSGGRSTVNVDLSTPPRLYVHGDDEIWARGKLAQVNLACRRYRHPLFWVRPRYMNTIASVLALMFWVILLSLPPHPTHAEAVRMLWMLGTWAVAVVLAVAESLHFKVAFTTVFRVERRVDWQALSVFVTIALIVVTVAQLVVQGVMVNR